MNRGKAGNVNEIDFAGLEKLIEQGASDRGERAADYYRLLGFTDYQAIDVNDRYGSLVMDLNRDLAAAYDYGDTFSLVTNNGTGEHVFNQDAIYRNVHQLTRVGGLMLHVMPFYEFVNHGFFAIQPNLYPALAHLRQQRLSLRRVPNQRRAHALAAAGLQREGRRRRAS